MFPARRSVSDRNKLLLLKSPDFFTHLALGLFVDPHPRGVGSEHEMKGMFHDAAEMQALYQRDYAEAVLQLALFPSGREALRQEAAVVNALEKVAKDGMTPEAQEHAGERLPPLSFLCLPN